MTRSIWLISDTHFFHENILKFEHRDNGLLRPGFSSVEEMNEFMVEKWNSVVKQGDIVYHLGDVVMGRPEGFRPLFNRLKGSKRLIVGNHDDIKWIAPLGLFAKIYMWRIFRENGVLLSHVPIHESSCSVGSERIPLLNAHGHIHANNSPPGRYVNLSVEAVGYTPVNIEDVHTLWRDQQKRNHNIDL